MLSHVRTILQDCASIVSSFHNFSVVVTIFGNKQMLFAGDFGQLPPVGDHPLYKDGNLSVWHTNVNTFLELKTNHRFNNDPEWGELLERFSNDGPTDNDIDFINSKIVTDGRLYMTPISVNVYKYLRNRVVVCMFESLLLMNRLMYGNMNGAIL